jgi:hypothetical protein
LQAELSESTSPINEFAVGLIGPVEGNHELRIPGLIGVVVLSDSRTAHPQLKRHLRLVVLFLASNLEWFGVESLVA